MEYTHLRDCLDLSKLNELQENKIGVLAVHSETNQQITDTTRTDMVSVLNDLGLSFEVLETTEPDLLSGDLRDKLCEKDFVVKIVHGIANRRGIVQGTLDLLGVPFTGHSLTTDLLSQNKLTVKAFLKEQDIPTPPYTKIPRNLHEIDVSTLLPRAEYLMLKPSTTNASVGIRCMPRCELTSETLNKLSSGCEEYFLEEFVKGRIMTIGTIPVNREVYASHPLEYALDNNSLFMDENWKYNPKRVFPEDLNETIIHRMQSYARKIHSAINAEGIARSDYILTNNGDIFCLEINSNVGLGKNHDVATAITEQGDLYEHLVFAHLLTARNKK